MDTTPTPSEGAWRALARSSPWRWRSAHFRYADAETGDQQVEAWVERPGRLRVRVDGREDHVLDETRERTMGTAWLVRARGGMPSRYRDRPPSRLADWVQRRHATPARRPHQVAPVLRPDGLVAERPGDPEIEWDDPMWQSYTWVAMLDPVELSHHTTVTDVRAADRLGRPTWWARVAAVEGYDPRCTCCPLLWSEVSDREEHDASGTGEPWVLRPGTVFPEAYDVALDVQTGIVVERTPVGPTSQPDGHRLTLLEVG